MRLEREAAIHSLHGKLDTVFIIGHIGNNRFLAEYKGETYTAIWNPFRSCYYVDDVYGKVEKQEA